MAVHRNYADFFEFPGSSIGGGRNLNANCLSRHVLTERRGGAEAAEVHRSIIFFFRNLLFIS